MKILIVGQVFYPDNFRVNDIVKELAKSNEVTMITGLPDYEKGYIPNEYRWFRKRTEVFHNANVVRLPMLSRRNGAFHRSLNYLSFMISSSIYTFFIRKKYDVVFCYQTSPITMFVPGLVYAKKNKVKSILYTTDLWPESVKAMNIKENTIIFRIITYLSRKIYRSADKIIVSSPSFKKYLEDVHDVSINTISYLPQYTDELLVRHDEILKKRNMVKVKFTFAGNIGIVQDLEVILEAVKKLIVKTRDFVVNIVGSGSHLDFIKNRVIELNIENYVIFHGRKDHTMMHKIYLESDVCLLSLKDIGYIGKTIPSKLQTYFAKGKAVVAATSGDSKQIIEESNAGYCVKSGDFSGLADCMEMYINNPDLINEHGLNALNYYRMKFSREFFFGELNSYLED